MEDKTQLNFVFCKKQQKLSSKQKLSLTRENSGYHKKLLRQLTKERSYIHNTQNKKRHFLAIVEENVFLVIASSILLLVSILRPAVFATTRSGKTSDKQKYIKILLT